MPCRALQRGLSVEVDCRTMSRLGFQNSCLEAWYVLIKPTCFVIDRRRTRHCGSRGEKRGTSLPRSQSASRLGDLKKPVILSALPDELGLMVVDSQFRSDLQFAGRGLSSAQKHVRGGNVQVIGNQGISRLALRTCRSSKADLCARWIAKSALDSRVRTIPENVPLTSILMSGQFSHRLPAE